jgi:hypothetical protein
VVGLTIDDWAPGSLQELAGVMSVKSTVSGRKVTPSLSRGGTCTKSIVMLSSSSQLVTKTLLIPFNGV